jgi:hypothetical protein
MPDFECQLILQLREGAPEGEQKFSGGVPVVSGVLNIAYHQ